LPEVGDLDKPRLVFFFDEAHLLFDDAPPALQQRVEQVVRLIRSKGVGVYFISQLPDDVPDAILGQLGNRVQHALRAFTPKDRKSIRTAAENFVQNPAYRIEDVITQLGVGEALVSTLRDNGTPGMTERTLICPPRSRIGTIDATERSAVRARSPVGGKYDQPLDRDSAEEMLARRASQSSAPPPAPSPTETPQGDAAGGISWGQRVQDALFGTKRRQGMIETMGKSAVRTVGNQLGRSLLRGVLGTLFKR
jgi:DNA helicase HerA-like ATPase